MCNSGTRFGVSATRPPQVYDHRGGELVFFDHQARNRLRRTQGADVFSNLSQAQHLRSYRPEDGVGPHGVGHRTKRINRH